MARATTAWEIVNSEPQKLQEGQIDVEKALENWIETHPEMLEPGLLVLARQLETAGGLLDLLCLDESGRLVVVELKRDSAYRDALAQVLDYTACIAGLSYDDLKNAVDHNRSKRGASGSLDELLRKQLGDAAAEWTPDSSDPRIVLVGAGADPSLRRIVDYLTSRYDVPVNGVFFDVYRASSGSMVLVRSAVVADEQAAQQGRRRGRGGITTEELLALASENGVKDLVEPILTAWSAATGREGRPERKSRFWSLATRARGTTIAARLYPWDDAPTKVAWLQVLTERLAEDLGIDQTRLDQSLKAASITLNADGYIKLHDATTVNAVVQWINHSYSATSSAPEANGAGEVADAAK